MGQFQPQHIALVAILSLVAGLGGYYLGSTKPIAPSTQQINQSRANVLTTSPLFKTQTAIIVGEIVKVDGSTLTVQDETGRAEQFPVSQRVVIYRQLKEDPKRASASSDFNTIELNKIKLISLEVIDSKYQVTSISDLPKI